MELEESKVLDLQMKLMQTTNVSAQKSVRIDDLECELEIYRKQIVHF